MATLATIPTVLLCTVIAQKTAPRSTERAYQALDGYATRVLRGPCCTADLVFVLLAFVTLLLNVDFKYQWWFAVQMLAARAVISVQNGWSNKCIDERGCLYFDVEFLFFIEMVTTVCSVSNGHPFLPH